MSDYADLARIIHAGTCYGDPEDCRRNDGPCGKAASYARAAGYRKVDQAAEVRTEWGARRSSEYDALWAASRKEADVLVEQFGYALVSRTVYYSPWVPEETA